MGKVSDAEFRRVNASIYRHRTKLRADGPTPLNENFPKEAGHASRFSTLNQPVAVQRLLSEANLPERHLRAVNAEECDEWIRARDSIVSRVGRGFSVALLGGRGTGKTQLGVHVLVGGCLANRSARYAKAMDFFLAVRATYKSEEKSELDAVAEFVGPLMLVLDELQVRGESEFEDRMLTYMLDKRYDAMKDTILIANLTPEEFEASMGYSIADRMVEAGGVIVCNWKSFRKASQ